MLVLSRDTCGFSYFLKHETAYELRISEWSSDVCSSDLVDRGEDGRVLAGEVATLLVQVHLAGNQVHHALQALAHADRPGYRRALDAEHAFDFIEQVDRV